MSGTDPSKLSSSERALLERRLLSRRKGKARPGAIPRRSPGATVPASFAQERLWFVEQITPGSAAYQGLPATAADGMPCGYPECARQRAADENATVTRR